MFKPSVITSLTEKNQDEVGPLCHQIINELTLNAAAFPALPVSVATFTTQVGNYETILGKPEYAGKTAELAAARTIVDTSYHKNGVYVNTVADGNEVTLNKSGYPLAKTPSPVGDLPAPAGMAVGHGSMDEFTFDIKKVEHAVGYLIAFTNLDSPDPNPYNWTLRWTSKTKTTLGGFQHGSRYRFAATAVGSSKAVNFFISAQQLTAE